MQKSSYLQLTIKELCLMHQPIQTWETSHKSNSSTCHLNNHMGMIPKGNARECTNRQYHTTCKICLMIIVSYVSLSETHNSLKKAMKWILKLKCSHSSFIPTRTKELLKFELLLQLMLWLMIFVGCLRQSMRYLTQ